MHPVKEAGYSHQAVSTGASSFIQRFGGALNLNVHFDSWF
jgi:hypothetical protein